MKKRPLILISNDDGYQAKGINELVRMLHDMADIIVCAPDTHQSGTSRSFSGTIPLRLTLRRQSEGIAVWSCSGTPVDSVKMALSELLDRVPDMVIGGINHGDNASVNTHYSGTMGVAVEGCLKGIPSVAFSLCSPKEDADFQPLEPYIRRFTQQVLEHGLPQGVCLNINFPVQQTFGGVKICRMAKGSWYNELTKCHHPRGYDYYWMVGHYRNDEPEAEDTDNWALKNGYVAITPTRVDVTDYDTIRLLKDWEQ